MKERKWKEKERVKERKRKERKRGERERKKREEKLNIIQSRTNTCSRSFTICQAVKLLKDLSLNRGDHVLLK